jgi:hypothetical protein
MAGTSGGTFGASATLARRMEQRSRLTVGEVDGNCAVLASDDLHVVRLPLALLPEGVAIGARRHARNHAQSSAVMPLSPLPPPARRSRHRPRRHAQRAGGAGA